MQAINISGLNKFYGRKQVLFDIYLDFPQAQMVALIGPSGSGKSTLLRHINGLNVAESGQIQVNGQDLFNNGRLNRQVRQQRSKIGYIFQQFNLVNRLSVLDNVLIGALGRIPKWRAYLRVFTQAKNKKHLIAWRAWAWLSLYTNARLPCLAANNNVWRLPKF